MDSIKFKDVVALTGTPGLHQVVKADDRALVVESLDERRRRQLVKGSMVVSKLADISIYTTDTESEPLLSILKELRDKYGAELPVSKKAGKDELMGLLAEVLPNYDDERVYPSNVKKIIAWHQILHDFNVELAEEEEKEEAAKEEAKAAEATEVDEATEATAVDEAKEAPEGDEAPEADEADEAAKE